MSKGDWYRKVDREKFSEHYDQIFGERQVKTWDPKETVAPGADTPGDPTPVRNPEQPTGGSPS